MTIVSAVSGMVLALVGAGLVVSGLERRRRARAEMAAYRELRRAVLALGRKPT